MPKRVINEGDAMPSQPDAEGERQKFPRFTMTGIGVTIQGDVGGKMMSFERLVDATIDPEALDAELDMMIRAFERQKAIVSLRVLMLDLVKARLSTDKLPSDIKNLKVQRALARTQIESSYLAAYQVSGKRGGFRLTSAQEVTLHDFDAKTNELVSQMETQLEQNKLGLPMLVSEIKKLKAQVRDYVDPIDQDIDLDEEAPLAEAAE